MNEYMNGGIPYPRTAKGMKELVGKTIEFVLSRNVDRSGRGYFTTDTGKVVEQYGKNIRMDNGNWYFWREILEYREIPDIVSE